MKDWYFLLVFHGGMVIYLLLHNIVVPSFAMLGSHNFSLNAFSWWYLPQLFLFYAFYKKKKKWIFSLVIYTHIILILSTIHLLNIVVEYGMSKAIFTWGISLLSLFFFLLGFHLKFKKNLEFKIHKSSILIGIIISLIHIYLNIKIFNSVIDDNGSRNTNTKKMQNEQILKEFTKSQILHAPSKSIIEDIGPSLDLIYIKDKWIITNKSKNSVHLRIENFDGKRWIFNKIIVMKSNDRLEYLWDKENLDGIYRMFSPTHVKWPKQYIFKNMNGMMKLGHYHIYSNKIKIVNNMKNLLF